MLSEEMAGLMKDKLGSRTRPFWLMKERETEKNAKVKRQKGKEERERVTKKRREGFRKTRRRRLSL